MNALCIMTYEYICNLQPRGIMYIILIIYGTALQFIAMVLIIFKLRSCGVVGTLTIKSAIKIIVKACIFVND